VSERDLVAEALPDGLPERIERLTVDLLDGATAIARQILGDTFVVQHVAAGTVARVEVTDDTDRLQLLEIAIDGGEIKWGSIQADRDLLRR
jgi:hypothetical protein